jgi:predicted kinase
MNWYKTAQEKTLYIMRGLPGSGKSTLANQLGEGGTVLGSDDFFMVDGEYVFDPDALGYAHFWNQGRVEEAMKQGASPIVADNTNVQKWEMKPYVELAIKYGYEMEFAEPQTPWKFDLKELSKRNTHGVPEDVIQSKLDKWDDDISIENILESEKPE